MFIFEFNDNLHYRTREALVDELHEIADRLESGCKTFPSCKFNAPAGWLHDDRYGDDIQDDEDDDDYDSDMYMEDED